MKNSIHPLRLAALTAVLFSACLQAAANWTPSFTNTQWKFFRIISNLNPVLKNGETSLTDFPVLIRVTNDPGLASVHSNAGDDITFVGWDGRQLFHEIEYFNKGTGDLVAWVNLPSFTNLTTIFLFYSNADPAGFGFDGGNSVETFTQTLPSLRSNALVTSRRTWNTNFLVVFHFNESANTTLPRDSGRHSNHATTNGLARLTETNVQPPSGALLPSGAGGALRIRTPYTNLSAIWVPFTNSTGRTNLSMFWTNVYHTVSYYHYIDVFPNDPGSGTAATNYTIPAAYANNGSSAGMTFRTYTSGQFNWVSQGNWVSWPTASAYLNSNSTTLDHFAYRGGFPLGSPEYPTTNSAFLNGKLIATAAGISIASGYRLTGNNGFCIGGAGNPGTGNYFSAPGYYEEARLVYTPLSDSWIATEYANINNLSLNQFYSVSPAIPILSASLSNSFFPTPASNRSTLVALDASTISLLNRGGANWITNVKWIASNVGATAGMTLDQPFASDVADAQYTNWVIFPQAGAFNVFAVIHDKGGNVFTTATNAVTVMTQANIFDLARVSFSTSNSGIVIDLGNGGTAAPFQFSAIRGTQIISLSNAGGGRYLDTNLSFFDTSYTYLLTLDYGEGRVYARSMTYAPVEPAVTSNLVDTSSSLPEMRQVRNMQLSLTLPPGNSALNGIWSVDLPPQNALATTGSGLGLSIKEWILTNRTAGNVSIGSASSLQVGLKIVGSSAALPSVDSSLWPASTQKERIGLGQWNGGGWTPIPTTRSLGGGRLLLEGVLTNAGRIGILYGATAESVSGIAKTKPAVRIFFPGSDIAGWSKLHFDFENPGNLPVTLRIHSSASGETLFAKTGLSGLSYDWDGLDAGGRRIAPGAYLYQIQIGKGEPVRGSFVVQWK